MAIPEPAFTLGVEEEYLLVDPETRELSPPPPEMTAECEATLSGQFSPEFFKTQIEVGTKVCANAREARAELARLRGTLADIARRHGRALIASSTHPFTDWQTQSHVEQPRYDGIAREMGAVVQRLLICGTHVHVAVEDDDLRVDLMNQICYFLPHLLALSGSSPFWRGTDTGLSSYRLSVFRGLPRTGLPDQFISWGEYERFVSRLVDAGVMEDATKLWWDVRPSARYPTLEMRIADVCTRVDDAVAVAAIYQCLLRMLWRLRRDNQRWRIYMHTLLNENRWRAQRYGVHGELIDFGKGEALPYDGLLEEIIELTREDAEALDCVEEVRHAREIVRRGTSADRQRAVYRRALNDGASERDALVAVVDHLIEETMAGIGGA